MMKYCLLFDCTGRFYLDLRLRMIIPAHRKKVRGMLVPLRVFKVWF